MAGCDVLLLQLEASLAVNLAAARAALDAYDITTAEIPVVLGPYFA